MWLRSKSYEVEFFNRYLRGKNSETIVPRRELRNENFEWRFTIWNLRNGVQSREIWSRRIFKKCLTFWVLTLGEEALFKVQFPEMPWFFELCGGGSGSYRIESTQVSSICGGSARGGGDIGRCLFRDFGILRSKTIWSMSPPCHTLIHSFILISAITNLWMV